MHINCGMLIIAWAIAGLHGFVAASASAQQVLDSSNGAGPSSFTRHLKRNNFRAQSFTTTQAGMLTQVDVQLGQFPNLDEDVTFQLTPLIDGLPPVWDREVLFSKIISANDIPDVSSLDDPPPFVSIDVSSTGLRVQPGQQFAIAMKRGGTEPTLWWSTPGSYSDGNGFFRALLDSPWVPQTEDLTFQTWIDPTPNEPYQLRIDPAFDMHYRPGDTPTLHEGEPSLLIGGIPGHESFPEERPIIEFPLGDLPSGAIIDGGRLVFDWGGSSGAPRVELTGYAGDGLASFSDATTTGQILAVTPPTSASSPEAIELDAEAIKSLVGQSSHLGVRMRSLDTPEYVSFYALESHPSLSTARLIIDYRLLDVLGDFNADGVVNAADLDQYVGNIGVAATGALEVLDLNGDGTVGADDLMQHYSSLIETSNGGTGTFAGDANLDGNVDVLGDAAALVANLGNAVTSWAQGDFNGSGDVDVLGDASLLVANLGKNNTGNAGRNVSAIPEPCSAVFLLLGGMSIATVRRRSR